jgi:hypothetical protein
LISLQVPVNADRVKGRGTRRAGTSAYRDYRHPVQLHPAKTLERFEGPERFARAVDASLDRLATFVKNPGRLPELLFGKA